MLLVLASRYDEAARALVQQWSAHGAALLTPDSLSTEGWRYGDVPPEDFQVMVEGMPLRTAHIRGVLVRMPCVPQDELRRIRPDERAYVATEMTAFLLAWLSCLSCPVLNRPTPGCLAGPGWRPEQWLHVAARTGVPVVPVRRCTDTPGSYELPAEASRPHTSVSVVGEQCLGPVTPLMEDYALRLARAAGVELLAVQFAGPPDAPVLAGANIWPELHAPRVSEVLLSRLLRDDGAHQEGRS
jgi:hypothetical protein